MALTPRDDLDAEKRRVGEAVDAGVLTPDASERILELADALDDQTVRHKYRNADGQIETMTPRSIKAYCSGLRQTAKTGVDLSAATAAEINDTMDDLHDDVGRSKSTLSIYQAAAKAFYRYHDDLGVDPDAIVTFTPDPSPSVDETDMFTPDEVAALRRACGETRMPLRNRAFLELLIFTGQRMYALLTLRVGDIDLENGYIHLNADYAAEHGGLKGALDRGRKRPMFGARKYVRDWLNHHPYTDDDDAWVFIGDPSHPKTTKGEHWAQSSANGFMRRLGDRVDTDKPVEPHNFRHYCATILYREYDVDSDVIRMLFGHKKDSKTLESTYSHLFDEDYIHKAEEALGYRDAEETETLTPETCPTCGELLDPDWRQCPSCEERFAPTEETEPLAEMLQDDFTDVALSSDISDEERAGLRALLDSMGVPEPLAEKLVEATD